MNEMHKIEIYNKKYNIKTKITIQKIQKRQLMVCQLQVIPFISNYKIILSNLHNIFNSKEHPRNKTIYFFKLNNIVEI